ncbi:uncharacterized protein LOC142357910 [Convolutriloba macropyga]|uniref:uncharacterized protein LOC142357910 n=1 Tax=Convolutriloba macropyga TaxID=536237 RepID=UPI003F51EF9E
MATASLDFKPASESYLKKLRMPVKRGMYEQPKQFESYLPEKEVVKFHQLGVQPATPHREDYGKFDRTNGGYLSAAAREDRQIESKIASMADQFDEKPQQNNPETVQKLRPMTSVQPRAKVESDSRVKTRAKSAVVGPFSWQDRGELENVKRGKLIYSGWKDPQTGQSDLYTKPNYEPDKQKAVWSDRALSGSIYKSSAQRAMEDVNWDSKIPLPLPPPETTVEKHADPVNEKLRQIKENRKDEASEWQMLAKGWDYNQMRNQHLFQKRPYSYSSMYKTHQIPNYKGHSGGLGERDDTYSEFHPLAVKRNDVPPYYGTGRTGNIPGYTGKIWWLGVLSAHNYKPENSDTTMLSTHVRLPPASASEHAKREKLTKLITTVPPHNPFRRGESTEIGGSEDVNKKATTQSAGLTRNRQIYAM